MGLAASQARLLTITARLADNELRSQTINNAKMRLATQSAQASDAYVAALNNAQLMFTNTNENGLAQTQALTFNSLTQYSQYNNQYGLVNSSGQTLVSEKDAKIFEANKTNLEGFLKAHGLEWETTYFDETSGDLVSKLKNFYTGDYAYIGNLFNGMGNAELKELYLNSISEEASIENVNYNTAARNYYSMITSLKTEIYPDLRAEVFGSSTSGTSEKVLIETIGRLGTAAEVINELIQGDVVNVIDDSLDNGAKFSLHNLNFGFQDSSGNTISIISGDTTDRLRNLVASLVDDGARSGYATQSVVPGVTSNTGTYYKDIAGHTDNYNEIKYEFSFSYKTPKPGLEARNVTFTIEYKDILTDNGAIYVDSAGNPHNCKNKTTQAYIYATTTDANGNPVSCDFTYKDKNGNVCKMDQTSATSANGGKGNLSTYSGLNLNDPGCLDAILQKVSGATGSGGDTRLHYYNIYPDNPSKTQYYMGLVPMLTKDSNGNGAYKLVAEQYLNAILSNPDTFDAFEYLKTVSGSASAAAKKFDSGVNNYSDYGITIDYPKEANLLMDFDKLIQEKGLTRTSCNEYMRSVIESYMVEKMVDVLGEPKYGWVDRSSNATDNPDSKAQWLTNLFNRMQKGYKVLENGLASSKEWLEYALESGLVTMEQVDLSYNWVSLDYKSCANINEDTDNSALVAKAEAEYNRAMNDIKQKDSLYDLQLKNIDTEHNSLQTEYDVIKGVISKNIERTMKFDQSA